jgi:hypothetical protein
MRIHTHFLFAVAFAGAATGAFAAISSNFEVFPPDINLTYQRAKQSVVVRATEANGVHRDVTAEAKITIADPATAKVENGVTLPVADGETTVKVEWHGQTAEAPVKVAKSQVDPPISFRLDVMPVFMKVECNRCHGAARGQDGFRLSLWGFDPEGDYFRLTRELPGRRINLAIPEASMLVTKADGEAPHTGGKRFEKGSDLYNTLLRWLQSGAPNDPADVAKVQGIEILPG